MMQRISSCTIFSLAIGIQIFCPLFNWVVQFLTIELYEFFAYLGYQPLIRYMICKYVLSFRSLPFHSVDGFLCCAESFQFDAVPFVCFCFYCFCFWCQILKIICELTAYIFFQEFYSFISYVQVFNPFQVNFCEWYKIGVRFQFSACDSVFPTPLNEQTVFSPLYILASFVTH